MPLQEIDRQLIDHCLTHKPGAWNEFVDRFMGLIYHLIDNVRHSRSLELSPSDVEDLAAEVFLGIVDDDYAVLRRFKGHSSLTTYLTVIARRICIREIVKRHREAELGHVSAHRIWATEESPADETEAVATVEQVELMLKGLPERDAEVVRLYHLKFLNYRQIAKQLKIPENSVGPILSRARQRMRRSG